MRVRRLFGHDEGGDLLWLIDLHVVPGAAHQVQLAVGEQRRGDVASIVIMAPL